MRDARVTLPGTCEPTPHPRLRGLRSLPLVKAACVQLGTDLVAISRRDPNDSLIHGRLRNPINGYLGEERSARGDVGRAYFVAKRATHGGPHLLPERRRLGRVGRS